MQNSFWYHKQAIIACFAFVLLFGIQELRAQSYSYPMTTMSGDTILEKFPPPDSTYVHTELILKFRNGILNKDSLCYDCEEIVEPGNRGKGALPTDESDYFFPQCKETLMAQQFTLGIISDPIVRSILSLNGVSYLRRMTAANPCADTLSITRFGDTIPMDPFNFMIAEFNNDSSVIPTIAELYLARVTAIEFAEPNFIFNTFSRHPADPQFDSAPQRSLKIMIGMEYAWGFDVGENDINIAIVDHGADYWRCDLGGDSIPNSKVTDGWDFFGGGTGKQNRPTVYKWSDHGTQVASIAGALTNNYGCSGGEKSRPNGMAGVAGGFGPVGLDTNLGTGANLLIYQCGNNGGPGEPSVVDAYTTSAILEATANSAHGMFGAKADVVNASWGSHDTNTFSIALRDAIAMAVLNGATFVAANGETTGNLFSFPSYMEPPSEVFNVVARIITSTEIHTRISVSMSTY